jgi:hypothetical protein
MPDLDPAIVRGEAERKVRAALANIEAAQRLLGKACEELCPIIGAVGPWGRVGKLYDKVHAEWHRVNAFLQNKRGRLNLDESGRAALARHLAANGPTP